MSRQLQKRPNSLTHVNRHVVRDYLVAKEQRDNRFWRYENGKLFTIYNGQEMDAATFDALYPVPCPVDFTRNPDNPDGTKLFLL